MPKTAQLSDPEHRKRLRRAVVAGTIGTAIEWYDFFLYSTVTGLVFAKLFFPQSSPLTGTLQAFAVYLVGFVARPIGAAVFGHFGDRIGRKSTLILTLALMGIATFLVGIVPTYASIGVWGAIVLTILRFIQGIGVGGEWGGSVLLAMEWARTDRHRGFVTSWPQLGVPLGMLLANLAVLVSSRLSGDAFLDWGWRIPFLLSIGLIALGLYIRLGIQETPTFRALTERSAISPRPVLEVIQTQWRQILLSAFARTGQQASFYVFTAFVFSYGTTVLGSSSGFSPGCDAGSGGVVVLHESFLRISLRSSGPQADLHGRNLGDRAVCICLLLDTRYGHSRSDFPGNRHITRCSRHDVWSTSGPHCGELPRAPAVLGRFARLSPRIHHCRWAGSADRHGSDRPIPLRLRYCCVPGRLWRDQRHCDPISA